MVRSGKFEMNVLVGGVPLPELGPTAAGEVYVETRFHTPSSYSVVVQEVRARLRARAGCCGAARLGARPRTALTRQSPQPPAPTRQADPFGEVFTQSWPVTPYTLRIVNNSAENVRAPAQRGGAR